jgi:hypothetical protein
MSVTTILDPDLGRTSLKGGKVKQYLDITGLDVDKLIKEIEHEFIGPEYELGEFYNILRARNRLITEEKYAAFIAREYEAIGGKRKAAKSSGRKTAISIHKRGNNRTGNSSKGKAKGK